MGSNQEYEVELLLFLLIFYGVELLLFLLILFVWDYWLFFCDMKGWGIVREPRGYLRIL